MKKVAFIVAAASLFALAPIANRFGPVASSVALVWLGVLVAVCASGTAQSMAVASGALGAFGAGVLAPVSPAAAGAVIVAAAFAERTTRIRSQTARAVHVMVALVGGALAGSLSTAFTASSMPVMAVAIVVASVLAALPLLVEADDPVAHALERAAADVSEPARSALVQGAELRRTAQEVPLDGATAARVKKTWQSLLRLAEARVRLERSRPRALVRIAEAPLSLPAPAPLATASALASDGAPAHALEAKPALEVRPAPALEVKPAPAPPSAADAVLGMVDQRIAEHVTVLAKAYTAVDTARAAAVGLDDADLRTVDSLGDSLEDVSRALVEVKGGAST
jgi:MFS family permease